MKFFRPLLVALALPLISAQDSSSPSSSSSSASGSISASATRSSNSTSSSSSTSPTPTLNISTITTTLTTYPTTTTLSESIQHATTLTMTFTINATSYQSLNQSIWQGNYTNGTIPFNGENKPWEEGDGFLPFHVKIDPAYGVLGALLIISGIPVAVLGGKNRWSSNAIASGYALMLFTLVMILRFGVQPNLQPPSPNPPSTTLRGLYLLACIITAFFGGALGIFLYAFAKYWVSAIGGFTFGWFLLATRQGGLITSVLGRWSLLGGLAVGGLVASLPKQTNEWMMLISTAWIGATAFTLGVDCYTRAGLKEFYVYNLGFHDLFPKLYTYKYPLTQTMTIELGILAAMVVIGAAIQFRVLNMLTKRYKKMREEEAAKKEAEEIERAAERFKNVGAELNEWEEKHGNASPTSGPGSSGPTDPYGSLHGSAMRATRDSMALPQLGFESDRDHRASSTLSLLRDGEPKGSYEPIAMRSPSLAGPDTPMSMFVGLEELKSGDPGLEPNSPTSSDPELEQQMKLLAEVKKAREDIRGSLDRLRSNTPNGSIMSNDLLGRGTPTPTLGTTSDARNRHLSTTSSKLLDYPEVRSDSSAERRERHTSTTSSRLLEYSTPTSAAQPQSEWEKYLAERKVISPAPSDPSQQQQSSGYLNRTSAYSSVPLNMDERRERTSSVLEPRVSDFGPSEQLRNNGTYPTDRPVDNMQRTRSADPNRRSTYHDYLGGNDTQQLGTPIIIGSAAGNDRSRGNNRQSQQLNTPRAMTYDELAERHRKRISKLQDPVTSKMKEEIELEKAKEKWEKQKLREKEEMKRKERERFYKEQNNNNEQPKGKGREEGIKQTQEWRKSVVLSPPPQAVTTDSQNQSRGQRQNQNDPKKRASRQFAS
ncbi:uncharacterized protein L201_003607 [Kwoniella dendrophila CBS 6074]|uniref:TM7S3/TM198-like domain-containing protein n=1 Tax=Kwoniella dendrophila CBS 6074 TaxID=1295534 RepID=A0AAX4JTN6_9TREE